jgi:hypothetical protein
LRLAEGYVTPEIVAHELAHAALQIYRMNVHRDIRLGEACGEREEQPAVPRTQTSPAGSWGMRWYSGDRGES